MASAERIIMAAHVHLMLGIYEPDRKRSKLRKNFTALPYVSFGVAKRSISQSQTVRFAVPNGPFRSLKRSISQRQKGRFAKPVNIS